MLLLLSFEERVSFSCMMEELRILDSKKIILEILEVKRFIFFFHFQTI